MVMKVSAATQAWLMVVIGATVVNVGALGIVSIGVMVPSVMATFEANLSVVALASSITLTIGGVAAPIIGRLLDRWSVRRILTVGAVVTTIGNLIVYFSTSVWIFNAGYFVVGLGVACLAPMVIVKLLKSWFDDNLGLATGFATLPISVILAPLAVNAVMGVHGWRGVYLIFAVLAAVTCVIVQFATQQTEGHSVGDRQEETQAVDVEYPELLEAYRSILASTWFWVVTLSMAILSAGSVVLLTHMVVFGADLGLTNLQSVSLLSLFGLASLPGAPLFGWITDKFGPAHWLPDHRHLCRRVFPGFFRSARLPDPRGFHDCARIMRGRVFRRVQRTLERFAGRKCIRFGIWNRYDDHDDRSGVRRANRGIRS